MDRKMMEMNSMMSFLWVEIRFRKLRCERSNSKEEGKRIIMLEIMKQNKREMIISREKRGKCSLL